MKKEWMSLFLVFLLLFPGSASFADSHERESSALDDSDWTLTWEDNFEGTELDLDKWTIDTGNGFYEPDGTWVPGWGNEELQSYQEDNVRVEDGRLILEGREETVSDETGTYEYTSGKILSNGKFSQKYGKFEAKMKLPEGQGYWPAFWMMPEDDVYGGWAASGEIDIMESAGGTPDRIGGAIHYGGAWPDNTHTAKDYYFPDGRDITDFNVYSLEWEPGEMRWYVNDELYQTLNSWSTTGTGNAAKYSYPAPFDQEFHLILNLAIGGWYGGDPDETTELPGQVEVEYVRAYELTGREYREPVEPEYEADDLPDGAKEPINGNYVYDPAFEEGFTNITNSSELENDWDPLYWNLVYLDEFGGEASVSTDELEDSRFAKVDIESGGNQPHSVQLIQNVPLGQGRWYQLSFDAKSDADRDMSVKIGGGPDRGYTAYSPNREYALTNEVQSYEMQFQMQHDTDAEARLELNMGQNDQSVWVGNVVLEEIDAVDPYNEDAPKTPLNNGNHVYNGTFDQGHMHRMTYWNLLTDGADAQASVDPADRELEVAIADGGEEASAIQVVQKGMNLLADNEYELTFSGRADEPRNIQVALISEDGEINYSDSRTIELSSSMEEHQATFTMPDVTDTSGQLVFFLGGDASNVFLDDVSMFRLTDHSGELTFDDIFPLKNGDFSNGLAYWEGHVQGEHDGSSSSANLQNKDGQAVFSIEDVGENPWDIILMQEDLSVKSGSTYVVEFDAKSSSARTMEVVVENAHYNRFLSEAIDLTEDMERHTFEFSMDADETVGLKYLLGNIEDAVDSAAHDVTIDNVRFEMKGERSRYFPLVNGDFTDGLSGWDTHVQGEFDGDSSASFNEIDEEAAVTVEHTGENPWDIQLFQPDLPLYENETYIVEFDARSTLDRAVEIVVDNGAPEYHRYFEETVSLTDSTDTFAFEFDMTADDSAALQFLLGNVAEEGISELHDIFIDNMKLEVKGAREALAGSKPDDDPDENGDSLKDRVEIAVRAADGTAVIGDDVFDEAISELASGGIVEVSIEEAESGFVSLLLSERQIEMLKEKNATVQINYDNDLILSIPSSLFEGDGAAEVIIEKSDPIDEAVSHVYNLTLMQDHEIMSQFNEPVTLTLKVEADEADYDSLRVYFYNTETEAWENIGGNYEDGFVTVETDHFSMFAVFADDPDETVPDENDPELERQIDDLEERINDLEERIRDLDNQEDIALIEQLINELQEEIAQLISESEADETLNRIQLLEEKLQKLKVTFADMKESGVAPEESEEDAGSGPGISDNGGSASGEGRADGSESGSELPSTATSFYNYILAGIVILLMGAVLLVKQRKKVSL